jgi:hypothetical protein
MRDRHVFEGLTLLLIGVGLLARLCVVQVGTGWARVDAAVEVGLEQTAFVYE